MIFKFVSSGRTPTTFVSVPKRPLCTKLTEYAAIWDNRSVFHSATFDYQGQGDRFGNRAVGIGERPYFDPQSKSRREALGLDAVA